MSSPESLSRVSRRSALVLGLAAGLGGCLRPMYGPTVSGARLQDVLAEIEVQPVVTRVGQERIGHYLRSELVYALDGSGQPKPKRYRLLIRVDESVQTPIVDTVSGRASSATIFASANVTLVSLADGVTVLNDSAAGTASYDRFVQRFANIRAARDAEIRAAKLLADQIRTRLAIALSAA